VYDITDNDSFVRVQNWVKELRKMLGTDIVLAIVGNKIDLERNRQVPQDKAEAYAASMGARHYAVSAKLNKGVNELFRDLATRMLERSIQNGGGGGAAGGGGGGGGGGTTGTTARRKKGLNIEDTSEADGSDAGGGCGC